MSKILTVDDVKKGPFPMILLVDNRSGNFLSSRIKAHSGNYNHIASIISPAEIASQDPKGYRVVSLETYFRPENFIKVWEVVMLKDQQTAWIDLIQKELNRPALYIGYDYLGIVGQYLHSILRWNWLKKIHIPWKKFCSEREATHLNKIFSFNISVQISPSELNKLFHSIPQMRVKGYWFDERS